jgi:hypothetical protein
LRSHIVDLAVTVRSRPRSQPAPQEDGVRCALMQRLREFDSVARGIDVVLTSPT